jgi:hypothetical protein
MNDTEREERERESALSNGDDDGLRQQGALKHVLQYRRKWMLRAVVDAVCTVQ